MEGPQRGDGGSTLTERLDEKLSVARFVLQRLRDGPMRWTPLTKAILREPSTPWKAQSILEWLLRRGYVERPERGVYRITEKGMRFLETL